MTCLETIEGFLKTKTCICKVSVGEIAMASVALLLFLLTVLLHIYCPVDTDFFQVVPF